MFSKPLKRQNIIAKPSPIQGYGVFATEDIPADEIIEECYVMHIPEEANYYFVNYSFKVGEKKNIIALGYGSIYNHASPPNAHYEYDPDRGCLIIRAARLIKAGEEICIHYGSEWFSCRNVPVVKPSFWSQVKKWRPFFQMVWRAAIVIGLIYLLINIVKLAK